ncbi:hypothetical protein LINPERPRIM_LOCUS11141 [Linum perenne]
MVKWAMRPLHYQRPDYEADPTGKLFTIELNYVHDAFACITYNGEKLVDYVHDAFLVGTYNQSYSVSIHPLNDSAQWLPGGGPVF